MIITSTLAYIDPGTGSILISTIIGIILTLIFTVKGFFYRIIARLSGKSIKITNDFSGKLVFFSEGENYWNVFKPVLENYIEKKQDFVYLTADNNDPGLNIKSEFSESYYIGNIKQAIIVLNKLKADMCVMTTPQLNVITLKRSKYVRHYCHLIHSPTDIHAYKKFAFDYFDSVLCSSKYQIENLCQLEKDRKRKKKILKATGCTYYDVIDIEESQKGESVLIAPTWGARTFFADYGEILINNLLKGGYRVIYRPHPQSWISDKELLEKIITRFKTNPLFSIDKSTNNNDALSKAKLLICDITSGMVYDVVFIHKKPVIAFDFEWDNGGYEASDIINETSTKYLLEDVGKVVSVKDVSMICEIIKKVSDKKINDEIIDKHIYNFRQAGAIAADQILSIYKEKK